MTTPHDDEPARDAWLSEALRHAPDAQAAPPAELSDAILREARNAVKTPRATAAPARITTLRQLWSWLARPPVAAGFATLMMATMVGVMWWDKPLDAPRPQAEAPAAMAPSTTLAQAPAATTPPPSAQDEAKAVARNQPEAPRRVALAPPSAAAPAAAKRERAVADRAPDAAATGELRGANQAAPAIAAAVPEPAPAATADTIAKSAAIAQAREEAAERRNGAPAQSLAKSAAPAAAPAAPPAPAPATALSLRRQGVDTRTPTIDRPERWTWQRGTSMQAMTPALQRWLVQLDGVARWRPADSAAPTAANANVLQLWRDGTLRATIALVDDTVWLTPADGAAVMAPLSPAAAASLRSALLAATP